MAESGGPTTQSGIHFQNAYAALRIGRLLDPRERRPAGRISQVRVEAPEHVDDTVITYEDGHVEYVQLKEAVSVGDDAWRKLWQDFDAQHATATFASADRLVLVLGDHTSLYDRLRAATERAGTAQDAVEWESRLTKPARDLVEGVAALLPPGRQDLAGAFPLFRVLLVEHFAARRVKDDLVPLWMPPSNVHPDTLFSVLYEHLGGSARVRATHDLQALEAFLRDDHAIMIAPGGGVHQHTYRDAVHEKYARVVIPGTNVSEAIGNAFVWPAVQELDAAALRRNDNDEEFSRRFDSPQDVQVDLRAFPNSAAPQAVIVAGAGFGKSTLVSKLAHDLARSAWLPVVVPLPEFADASCTVVEFLEQHVNTEYSVSIAWGAMCETGRVVLFFDGLDEVSAEERARVLRAVHTFGARFRRVPWLLTVRDAGAVPVPLAAPFYKLLPLNYDRIRSYAELFWAREHIVPPDELLLQTVRNPDVLAMLRIPLFLSLALATARPGEWVPRRRADVLERYLTLLFHPEETKAVSIGTREARDLRALAQDLALKMLEQGKTLLSERDARRLTCPDQSAELFRGALDGLRARGVLRHVGTQVRFVYPVVQEYLAAVAMLHLAPEEVADRIPRAAHRPWAQALQFVIEQHEQADDIVKRALAHEDDAFFSVLRLIGRCIVNGAAISKGTYAEVGDRLARVFYDTHKYEVGELLAEGFTRPLPALLRRYLEEGGAQYSPGAEMVRAAGDPTLTVIALRAALQNDKKYGTVPKKLSEAAAEVASEALAVYIAALEDSLSERFTCGVAAAMSDLPAARLPRDQLVAFADDEQAHPAVRLTAALLLGRDDVELIPFLDKLLRAPGKEKLYEITGGWFARNAIGCLADPKVYLTSLLADDTLSVELRAALLLDLTLSNDPPFTPPGIEPQSILPIVLTTPSLSSEMTTVCRALLAYLGDDEALEALLQEFPSLPQGVTAWLLAALVSTIDDPGTQHQLYANVSQWAPPGSWLELCPTGDALRL